MPVGYLIPVALVALGTLFSLVPVRRPRPISDVSYILGLAVNELPFFAFLYFLLLPTAMAFAEGDIDSPGAWAIVALAAAATPGLAAIAVRALGERDRIARALDDGLGAGWRAALDPDLAAGLRTRRPWPNIVLLPVLKRSGRVRRIRNLSYGDAGRRNRLDLYRHRGRPTGSPVLIHLHGGHYDHGRKNSQSLALLHHLASRGWVGISANYRLRPKHRHPDHIIDLKRIIAWVRTHADEHGMDPSTIVVAGSSAGAHLALLAAATQNDPEFQPGFEDADTSITAAVSLNAYYREYFGLGMESTGMGRITPDAPPILIMHGDLDPMVPVEHAREAAAVMRGISRNPVVYAELRGGHHAFDLYHSLRFEACIDGIEAFTAWVRSRDRRRAAERAPGSPTGSRA